MAKAEMIEIKALHPNKGQVEGLPKNPRFIRDEKYRKLVQSIKDDPEMLQLRELLVYDTGDKNLGYVIIGGNMRYRALKELGYNEAPCKVLPKETPVDKLLAYIIKDNNGYGEWDFEMLAMDWDVETLDGWGLDWEIDVINTKDKKKADKGEVVDFGEDGKDVGEQNADDMGEFDQFLVGDRIYPSDNDFDIPMLLIEKQPTGGVQLPFSGWGTDARDKKMVGTYHFYVDDYRFLNLWKTPDRPLIAGCFEFVEPNLSLFDTTPIAYGLQQIYMKRWIARWWQEQGAHVWVDLNVARKFKEYNKLGIPKGYNAFATRGYADRLESLKEEIEIAREISGKKQLNMLVYGGGKNVKAICQEAGLTYIEQFIQNRFDNE